jgi:hypothetical protein
VLLLPLLLVLLRRRRLLLLLPLPLLLRRRRLLLLRRRLLLRGVLERVSTQLVNAGRPAQPLQRARLRLPHALSRHAKALGGLLQGEFGSAAKAKAQAHHFALTRRQRAAQQRRRRFLQHGLPRAILRQRPRVPQRVVQCGGGGGAGAGGRALA